MSQPAEDDYDRSICVTCGTQYASPGRRPYPIRDEKSGDGCAICLDERQYVPTTGQKWTSWRKIDEDHKTVLMPEERDRRIVRIVTEPSFGIGQTPFIVNTHRGYVIWDCQAYLSPSAVSQISASTADKPLLGIAISHPHFFGSSVTWARMLGCKVFVSAKDKEWFMRDDDHVGKVVEFWDGEHKVISEGLTVIRCGGHFPGSSVLHWDRSLDPTEADLPTTGVVFCSDTFGVAADHRKMSFMYSYPNMANIQALWNALRPFAFEDIYGAWPGNLSYGNGRANVLKSARRFIEMEGWKKGDWVLED
ncbi:hypothetical protein GLOTRDRAFT_138443 [Gloeophyllum trabeum ATCC 11539]|uniref:Metallo-beta-lactamase domain-containing protein n=1 Tax=Gloeophyllum trabeum (strain ATCC 11539 / FP-39264 / Madison 617) TaxID=670483 RepID=S7Q7P1_GLOTA|nr:uncharacterized protein GLOTRDRAFT_138443 [Gloeophyllum trabeum ATCC 11539]EPQ55547.1 hypothetical protein GLOTRDRAFT_138443 [Gloeophyllum trabeum ATCC 11539]